MLINFCNADLVTKISSSVCECEGYGVNNLISKVQSERKKGFLVDYFIKPPVTIDIEFLCEIQLSSVILWSRVGSQKTIGVELLGGSCYRGALYSLGTAFMKSDENGFNFCKHGDKMKQSDSNNFFVQTFRSTKFLRIRCLQIKILKTFGSSVPALQRVEVWGEVYRNAPQSIVDIVRRSWAEVNNVEKDEHKGCVKTATTNDKDLLILNHCDEVDSQFKVPDEFLDPISCEIMTIPMIMPSGKVIDNSTLDRFIKEEANWGRCPSDPFTGKLFTTLSKPKMSDNLKTRIDKFLLDNCDEPLCKNLPRAIGNKMVSDKCKGSSLVSSSHPSSSECLSSTSNINILKFDSLLSDCSYMKKRKLSCTKNDIVEKDVKDCSISNPKKLLSSNNKTSTQSFKKYDEMKNQSLESLLKTTLASLPSFTKNPKFGNDQVLCFKCKSISVSYELPCKHHVCRLCLSALIETNCLKCTVCSTCFTTADPKRIHLTNQ